MVLRRVHANVPFMLPFDKIEPRLATEPQLSGLGCSVLGNVEMGARSALGPASVIRADRQPVRIGDDFSLGELGTVHVTPPLFPTTIGNRVTAGRNAVIHGCIVGDDCVFEDEVVILDGSVIADRVLIEAGSTVFPRSKLDADLVYAGSPAKPIRTLTADERVARAARLQDAIAASISDADDRGGATKGTDAPESVFVAHTAHTAGHVELSEGASVLFGVDLDAANGFITVGENTNIQDNTAIRAGAAGVIIGRDTTIGHNVRMQSCRIGERSLIGIGSVLSPDTIVDPDVLLAAGACTEPGQHLTSGWLWGGRPARPIAKLNEAKRQMLSRIVDHYRLYGATYRDAQSRLA